MFGELKYNIYKLYIFKFFSSFLLLTPVIVLFFQENGLSMTEIMVLQALYSVAIILLEIPTGYLADYYSRREVMIASSLFLTLGMAVYSFGTDFWSFLVGESVWALGVALFHGTDSAMFYDTLNDLGSKDKYQRLWGKANSYNLISGAVASILGGLIAEYSLRLTVQAMVPILLFLIPVSISLKEPTKHREVTDKHFEEIKQSFHVCFKQKSDLRFLILYSALIVTLTKSAYWIYQPYFEVSGLNLAYFGAVFAAFNIVAAAISRYAHLIEDSLGRKNSLISLTVLSSISFLMMGYIVFFFSFMFAFLHQIVRGFREPIISDYINGLVDSSRRSTVLSIEHMVSNLLYALIVPFVGLYTDIYSYSAAMKVLAATSISLGFLMLLLFYIFGNRGS